MRGGKRGRRVLMWSEVVERGRVEERGEERGRRVKVEKGE